MCPAVLGLKRCSWAAVSGVIITHLIIQDQQNCNTNPVLQCPVSACRGQSPHNEIKPTRVGSCIQSTYKYIRLELLGGGGCFFDKNKTLVLMAALVQTRVRHNNQLHKRAALCADGKQEVQVELSMQVFARHNLHASTTRN